MGRAILRGGLSGGFLAPDRVVVAEPDREKHAELARAGVTVVDTARDAIEWLDGLAGAAAEPDGGQVLLAVKPQMLPQVGTEIGGAVGGRIVISILAGTPGAKVRERLGGRARVVRAMPNLPATIGRGVTAVCLSAGAGPGDDEAARGLFACAGPVVTIVEEMMDAFTALAGSGPAYLFYLAEAMVNAAITMGFDRAEAERLVRATIDGSAALLNASSESPASLRGAVTSKGGTTAAAIAELDEAGVKAWIEHAILAARNRGAELARLA